MRSVFIDLHCHILPGLDDGAASLDVALRMAEMAGADGARIIACTPHVEPGIYDYDSARIAGAVAALQGALDARGLRLLLIPGGDVRLVADLPSRLRDGRAPTLGRSRYFLLEPPHDIRPPRLDREIGRIVASGYVPIVTHPERFRWLDGQEALIEAMRSAGCLFQITGAALTGDFGQRAQRSAERFLRQGLADLMASDGHDPEVRTPTLSQARAAAAALIGAAAADRLTRGAPALILRDAAPDQVRMPAELLAASLASVDPARRVPDQASAA